MEGPTLALAAFLQSQLEVLVATAEFYPGGGHYKAVTPSSLVTIEPYSPGGLRRLVLNVNSSLVHEAARALEAGRGDAVRKLGEAMVRSGSWPVQFIDLPCNVHWRMAPGLIGTPHALYAWPVPHQVPARRKKRKHLHIPLTIWPRRIYAVSYEINRAEPSATTEQLPGIHYVSEVWGQREDALRLEFQHLVRNETRGSLWQCFLPILGHRDEGEEDLEGTVGPFSALLTYAPALPVFCIADVLVESGQVPRHSALAEAADFLARKDRLFALSLFFGVPLIDRSLTLNASLRTAPLARPPPSSQEVSDFCNRLLGQETEQACRDALRAVLLQRARELWDLTETSTSSTPGNVCVCWSGGIDSTAALCALLETAQEHSPHRRRMHRLKVILDEESMAENPSFHQKYIANSLEQVPRDDKPLSWHEYRMRCEHKASVFVTGELGDQIFGSDRCKAAFPDVYGQCEDLPASLANSVPTGPPPEYQGVFVEKGLAAPWEETILPSLCSVGLIAEGGLSGWKKWIAPQLAVAPFPIVSTYDFLWWLNFSMKWQNVGLRCIHDGGEPLLSHAKNTAGLIGSVRHFYDDRDLECLSCVKSFHNLKFPDLTDWSTYKEPLKYFIKELDGDDNYYREKIKVGSLSFGAPSEADSYVNRFHGAVVDLLAPSEQPVVTASPCEVTGACCSAKIDPNSRPTLLTWGGCGLSSPSSGGLKKLVRAETLSALGGYPSDSSGSIYVDPWEAALLETSPFNIAPFFAEDDERQRRVFNPVSKITLVAKCAALLTTEILEGRSFLDLGACLGASTHWALCHGANQATAVEIQENFCNRAETMLRRAETMNCWPSVHGEATNTFKVVCCGIREYLSQCSDASHDVVLAAGVLHCFVDPIQVLLEITRVASHAVLIEMTHPNMYMDGYLLDPDIRADRCLNSVEIGMETLPGMNASVRPLQRRIEEAGLLQVAPQAVVNMADNDASFVGLATLPSRMAIESSMRNFGFNVTRVFLKEHPVANDEVQTYTGPRKHRALSTRYFLQCVRKASVQAPIRSLESLVHSNDRTKSTSWVKAKSWFSFGSEDDTESPKTQGIECEKVEISLDDPTEKWEFDSTVASRFQREARCHIPDYEEVVSDSIKLLENDLKKRSLQKQTLKVVDVGCATGNTLVKLLDCGFRNVHGVDIAVPMVEKASQNLRLAGYEEKAILHVSTRATDLPSTLGAANELGAVLINWTLQFVVREADRKTFLHNIANRMKTGALLVLTEKTLQNTLTRDAYYDFKKRMGVSENEIAIKEARLKGVLEPFDVRWYLDALSECGFSDICLFRAKFGFITFIARRNPVERRLEQGIPNDKLRTWPDLSDSAKHVWYEAKEELAQFQMSAWGNSTGSAWTGGSETGTVYGYVYEGPTEISVDVGSSSTRRSFTLHDGMYFACAASVQVRGGSGVLHLVHHHKAMFMIGGPVEDGPGRLPYIDGCTDSLLIAPDVKGAPCLNHLHFPPGVVQTQHTHPSGRSGVVVQGKGLCVCDDGDIRLPLQPGMAFVIPANVLHAFETTHDQELDVIAFHPDSDFGPSFDDHPMINRTMIDGISASRINSIQTRRLS